jgi:hypothetical protein
MILQAELKVITISLTPRNNLYKKVMLKFKNKYVVPKLEDLSLKMTK